MQHDSVALNRFTCGVVGCVISLLLLLTGPAQAQELPPDEESERASRSLEQDQATAPVPDTIPEATFEGGEVFRLGGAEPDTSALKAAVDPEITVESPNGGATWKVGREETIEWTEQGVSGDVRIWLYRGDGELVRKIYRWSGSGPAPWTVPPYIEPGDDYYIVVFSHQNPDVRDRSDGTFTIEEGTGPYITTLSPDWGDKWIKGEEATIRWDSRNVEGEVFIKLLKGEVEFVEYITQGTEDDGSYTWIVPEDLEPRTDYYVSVKSAENNSVWDTAGDFEIGYSDIDLIGTINTSGNAWDVNVAGDYAYVADEYGGLTVANVSNPNNPFEISTLEMSGQALTVDVEGTFACVASAGGGLRVVDISSPTSPVEVGSFDTPDDAWGVTVSDGYAYVATEAAGLYILDVSDPENPFEVGYLDTPGAAVNVRVRGSYAYVADLSGGLRIVDVSDPENPSPVSFVSTQDEIWDVDLAGTYAYVADHGLRVIDVSDPSDPAAISSFNATDDAWDVSVSGSYAYLAADGAGVRTIDVADPTNPDEVSSFDTPDPAYGITTAGAYTYVAAEEGGVYIIRNQLDEDVTPPAVPTGLSAEAGDQEVTLTWDPNTESDLAEYRLYRFVLPQQETEYVDNIPAGTTTYTDTDLTNDREHSYWITAVDGAGNESGFSNEVAVAPLSEDDLIITGVEPNPVTGSNGDQPLSVYGSGFAEGAFVILDDTEDDQPPFENPDKTTFVSSTELTRQATFTETAATWTAVVENPDGSQSDPFEFEVVAPDEGDDIALSFPTDYSSWKPYTAKVTSVFDHAMDDPYCPDDGLVVTFTGEHGTVLDPDEPAVEFTDCDLHSYKKNNGNAFEVNGNYVGTIGTNSTGPTTLNYDNHPGYDYPTPTGTDVLAAAPGEVVEVNNADTPGSGRFVKLQHGEDYQTWYLHLSDPLVSQGNSVSRGQIIGSSGATGGDVSPHLHFEVRKYIGGEWVPVDPYGWEGEEPDPYTQAENINLWQGSPPVSEACPTDPQAGENPSLSEISDCIDQLAKEYKVPGLIVRGLLQQESLEWKQFCDEDIANHLLCEDLPLGEPIISVDNGRGLTQITIKDENISENEGSLPLADAVSGGQGRNDSFTIEVNPSETVSLSRLEDDWVFNLRTGIRHLLAKKAAIPDLGSGEPGSNNLILENWYNALAYYNGYTAYKSSEHPTVFSYCPQDPKEPIGSKCGNDPGFPYKRDGNIKSTFLCKAFCLSGRLKSAIGRF